MPRWIIVHTDSFNLHAHGAYASELEAVDALWAAALDSGYEPDPTETPADYYRDLEDTWIVPYTREVPS